MANCRHFKKLGVEFVLSQLQWIAMISSIKSRQTMSVLKTCYWECCMYCCSAAAMSFYCFYVKNENATAFYCRMFKHFFTLNWLICDGSNSAPSVSFTLDIWGLKMKELSNRQIELRNGHQCACNLNAPCRKSEKISRLARKKWPYFLIRDVND